MFANVCVYDLFQPLNIPAVAAGYMYILVVPWQLKEMNLR